MRNISLLAFLFVLSISLNAFIYRSTEENYVKVKRAFSKEDFNLINKRLDKYGFENEYDKSVFFSYAPEIRSGLRKIGIKEKSVFLDALDVIGYFIKLKLSTVNMTGILWPMADLIDGYPNQIFDYLIQLDSDKIDYAEKYGEKARDNFIESYSKDKVNTVKQILKQILADLPKD
ncbi:exported protein A EppA [Borreliella afzelii]|uniref:exported protein A EppA n=1 Tax=Borreliella afzelii TaxID=29518 RepID=UPI003AF8AD41